MTKGIGRLDAQVGGVALRSTRFLVWQAPGYDPFTSGNRRGAKGGRVVALARRSARTVRQGGLGGLAAIVGIAVLNPVMWLALAAAYEDLSNSAAT